MGGLAVLFLMGLYFVLAVVAIVKVKPIWAKGLVLLTALLIPTSDAIYGRIKLQQMCKAEGGLKVYRVAEHVEGFMASSTDEFMLNKYGFQFSEGESSLTLPLNFAPDKSYIMRHFSTAPQASFAQTA